MRVLDSLRTLYSRFIDTTDSCFSFNYSQVEKIVNKFPEPVNDNQRAFYHYCCTMKRFKWYMRFFLNFGALISFIPIFLFLRTRKVDKKKHYSAVFFTDRIGFDTIPDSVLKQYRSIVSCKTSEKLHLTKSDVLYLHGILKYFFSPYFVTKTMLKLSMVSYCIDAFSPRAIIMYTESSFATSIITYYCELKNIKYIGVMHGERLHDLKLSFFRCTKYYAWDKEYVDMFISLRCDPSQFVIEVPSSVRMNIKKVDVPKYDFTFYLQDETKDSMQRVEIASSILSKKGNKICVRPHPSFSILDIISDKRCYEIEDSKKVSLVESFSQTRNVVGRFSTTLYQAWFNHVPIVIDDYTKPGIYEKMQSVRATILNREHKRLSDLLKDKGFSE